MNQITTLVERPRSVTIDMAERYGMEEKRFRAVVMATCFPPKQNEREPTEPEFAAFLLVAKHYDLNPLTKEIYGFRALSGGIIPIVSIDGWMNLINSHPQMDGLEFDDQLDSDGNLTAVTACIWRKDRRKPIEVTEYMAECRRNTNTWKQWPRRMLRHKAAIQCARYAFGFSGIKDQDEAERERERGYDDESPRTRILMDPPKDELEDEREVLNEIIEESREEQPIVKADDVNGDDWLDEDGEVNF